MIEAQTKQIMQNSLMSSNWNPSNVHLAHIFKSNDAAVLISYLIGKDKLFEEKNKKYKGWFFRTIGKIEAETACSERTQRRFLKTFEDIGLLQIKLKGAPPKRHFKIDYLALQALISVESCETTDLNLAKRQIQTLRSATFHISKTSSSESIIKKKNIKKENSLANSKHITPELFDKFWELYPKKTSKAQAKSAWLKSCKLPIKSQVVSRPTWKEVKKIIKQLAKSERWLKQKDKIPNASTWLNQYRWLNDAKDDGTLLQDFSNETSQPTRASSYRRKDGHQYKEATIQV